MNMANPVTQALAWSMILALSALIAHLLTENRGEGVPTRLQQLMALYVKADPPLADLADPPLADLADLADPKRNDETGESSTTMPKLAGNEKFLFPDSFAALAMLVKAGKVTETEALALGIGVRPGGSPKYKAARHALTVALAATQPSRFPELTPEQQLARQQLQLDD